MATNSPSENSRTADSGSHWQTWFGLFGGIAAWTLHVAIAYPLVYNGCAMGFNNLTTWLMIVTVVLGLVALLATLAAYWSWRDVAGPLTSDVGGVVGRRRLLAVMGMGLSGLSVLILIFSSIAILWLGPCS